MSSISINILYSKYTYDAKRRRIDFNLSLPEFTNLITNACHFCLEIGGNTLKYKGIPFNYNGIDRLNNSIGYQADNCVTCCKWCNNAKSNHNLSKFIEQCSKVASRKELTHLTIQVK